MKKSTPYINYSYCKTECNDNISNKSILLSIYEPTHIKRNSLNFGSEKELEKIFCDTLYNINVSIQLQEKKNEKELLIWFYQKEIECLNYLRNKNYSLSDHKYYKSIVLKQIQQLYEVSSIYSKEKESISKKLEQIKALIIQREYTNHDVDIKYIDNTCENYFGTQCIPSFLKRDVINLIKNRKVIRFSLLEQKKEGELIKKIFNNMNKKKILPFHGIDSKINLFYIFVFSNNMLLKNNIEALNIFRANYKNILTWFRMEPEKCFNFEQFFKAYLNISNEKAESLLKEKVLYYDNLLNNPNNVSDVTYEFYYYVLVSFFYCLQVFLIPINTNNNSNNKLMINLESNFRNPIIAELISNTIKGISKNIDDSKFNLTFYLDFLFNYYTNFLFDLFKHQKSNAVVNGCTPCINKADNSLIEIKNDEYNYNIIKSIIKITNNHILNKSYQDIEKEFEEITNYDSDNLVEVLIKRVISSPKKKESKINKIKLIPLSPKINSNIITIVISGFGSENDNHEISWKYYIDEKSLTNMFYFYNWPGGENNIVEVLGVIKNVLSLQLSKIFMKSMKLGGVSGKLLANIISSRKFFNNFKINLVGFSLGTNVIKNCLEEMYELSKYMDNTKIINNVVLLGGATIIDDYSEKWRNIFEKIVSGRIINCYSMNDKILTAFKYCVGEEGIGRRKIIIKKKNGEDMIENYEFDWGHTDYRNRFSEILKKIKI